MAEKRKRDFEPLPYYPWYWRAWRASRAVQRMHHEARAIYRELLDECWVRGGIPDDPTACAEIASWPARSVERHWDAIRAMFVADDAGLLVNERMEQERTESDKDRLAKSKGGKKSAEVRKRQRNTERKTSSTPVEDQLQTSLTSRAVQSSTEQSKAVQRVDEATRLPVAALAPEGARAPGDLRRPGMMSLADVDWRAQFEQAGAERPHPERKPIGFGREGES